MTSEQLHKANELQGKINMINELEAQSEQFRKERYPGSLPTSVARFLIDKPQLALEVLDFIVAKAIASREALQRQLSEL